MSQKDLQGTFYVTRKAYLTPHYLRVFLTGEAVPLLANTTVGTHNKLLIPPPGVQHINFPEFRQGRGHWADVPASRRPAIRTYTHRGIDLMRNEIWIDFVAHGTDSPASAWAINAQPGDALGVLMRDGKSALYPPASAYLLIGDATALPVLGVILEDLPAGVSVTCLLEVHGPADEQGLPTQADARFLWLHNATPQAGSQLADAVRQLALPSHDRFAYVAAEYAMVKAIRQYLRHERGWQRDELDAYAYWKRGVTEDRSAGERRNESQS